MADSISRQQHGTKGLFFGGKWVDMEDMGEHYTQHPNHHSNSDGKKCKTCPRSRSSNNAAKADGSYDVIIVGAGCIGGAIARELSKTNASVLLLEAADDVTQGATKGNSGIVHAGFDDTPGSVRAKFCWPGNQMFSALDADLHFGYQKNGSLVIALDEEEMKHLQQLKERGEKNGVQRLRIIHKEELFRLEPHVNPKAIGALLAPDAGNVIPYEYAIALIENAVDNNVELRIRREVTAIARESDAADSMFKVSVDHWEPPEYAQSMTTSKSTSAHPHHGAGSKSASGAIPAECPMSVKNMSKAVAVKGTEIYGVSIYVILPVVAAVFAAVKFEVLKIKGSVFQQTFLGGLLAFFVICCITVMSKSKIDGKPAFEHFDRAAPVEKGSKKDEVSPAPMGLGGRKLTVEEMKLGGSGSRSTMNGVVVEKETFRARYVINCAGGYSDVIASMVGDNSFKIKPRLGDYLLLNKNQGHLATHTLFPCPGPLGKGVLVQTTLWGNLILGPTARDTYLSDCMDMTDEEVQTYILSKCKQLVPAFDSSQVIHAFCGARAKSTRGDWIVEQSAADPHFINVAGIDSPGLAGSPAIAIEVMSLLGKAGLVTQPNEHFNPKRSAIVKPKNGWTGIRAGPVGKFTDPKMNVVCKCEKVTEAEILDALHRSLPIDSTQAIRKRTRAGMGECQGEVGNYDCETRVRAIIARELGIPLASVGGRPWPATSTLPQRWIEDAHRERMKVLEQGEAPAGH